MDSGILLLSQRGSLQVRSPAPQTSGRNYFLSIAPLSFHSGR